MAATFLSDEVISSSELRAKQKQWLDKATDNVITIVSGTRRYALINRERVSNLYAQKYYSELIIRFCQELDKNVKSDVFPCVEYLSEEEKLEFHSDLFNTYMNAMAIDNWVLMENLIDDWKATAEANSDPKIKKALLAKEDRSKYVSIKD